MAIFIFPDPALLTLVGTARLNFPVPSAVLALSGGAVGGGIAPQTGAVALVSDPPQVVVILTTTFNPATATSFLTADPPTLIGGGVVSASTTTTLVSTTPQLTTSTTPITNQLQLTSDPPVILLGRVFPQVGSLALARSTPVVVTKINLQPGTATLQLSTRFLSVGAGALSLAGAPPVLSSIINVTGVYSFTSDGGIAVAAISQTAIASSGPINFTTQANASVNMVLSSRSPGINRRLRPNRLTVVTA